MSLFQMKSLTLEELQNEPIENGSLVAVEDQGILTFDIDDKRINFNQVIIIGSDLDRLMIKMEQVDVPDNKLFFVQDTKQLWFWFEQNWILVNRDGKSAYQIAKEHGFTETEDEWLQSLTGTTGAAGESAYDVAVKNGYEGNEEEWLLSLKGPRGYKGTPGSNSYIHIKWGSSEMPGELLSEPDDYMGIAVTNESTAPSEAESYTWVKVKGEQGSSANVPENISAFTNDVGYATMPELQAVAEESRNSYDTLVDCVGLSLDFVNNNTSAETITEKLNEALQARVSCKNALIEKNAEVDDATPFNEYGSYIRSIKNNVFVNISAVSPGEDNAPAPAIRFNDAVLIDQGDLVPLSELDGLNSRTNVTCFAFSPDKKYLVIGLDANPFIFFFESGGTGYVRMAPPELMPAGMVKQCVFSQGSNELGVLHDGMPYVIKYLLEDGHISGNAPYQAELLPEGELESCRFEDGALLVTVKKTYETVLSGNI